MNPIVPANRREVIGIQAGGVAMPPVCFAAAFTSAAGGGFRDDTWLPTEETFSTVSTTCSFTSFAIP
jgi:hypothetical protein